MLYWTVKALLTPLLRGFYRIRVEGRSNLPRRGPVILAANHRSFLDSLFLPLVIGRRVTSGAMRRPTGSRRGQWPPPELGS